MCCGSRRDLRFVILNGMARRYWLVGVRGGELTASTGARFISELRSRFARRELKREGMPSVVRNVRAPNDVFELQSLHGKEFVEFYYVDEALSNAAKPEQIPLNRLQLVFGPPPASEVFTVISLPEQFAD
jgi:hypothetical protein